MRSQYAPCLAGCEGSEQNQKDLRACGHAMEVHIRGNAEQRQGRTERGLVPVITVSGQPEEAVALWARLQQLGQRSGEAVGVVARLEMLEALAADPPKIPKLLRAYLSIGAKICGPPALDREFKTIDFLTLLDWHELPEALRQKLLA